MASPFFVMIFVVLPLQGEEIWNRKSKSSLADTIRRTERPGRDQDLQPDRIIETFGVRTGDTVCEVPRRE